MQKTKVSYKNICTKTTNVPNKNYSPRLSFPITKKREITATSLEKNQNVNHFASTSGVKPNLARASPQMRSSRLRRVFLAAGDICASGVWTRILRRFSVPLPPTLPDKDGGTRALTRSLSVWRTCGTREESVHLIPLRYFIHRFLPANCVTCFRCVIGIKMSVGNG